MNPILEARLEYSSNQQALAYNLALHGLNQLMLPNKHRILGYRILHKIKTYVTNHHAIVPWEISTVIS
jgi:hypothetical protein